MISHNTCSVYCNVPVNRLITVVHVHAYDVMLSMPLLCSTRLLLPLLLLLQVTCPLGYFLHSNVVYCSELLEISINNRLVTAGLVTTTGTLLRVLETIHMLEYVRQYNPCLIPLQELYSLSCDSAYVHVYYSILFM